MNIKEIAEQVGIEYSSQWRYWTAYEEELEHFTALIRQDEAQACAKHYLAIMRDAVEQAVAKEREACAKVADNIAKEMHRQGEGPTGYILFVEECAAAIRARGEK